MAAPSFGLQRAKSWRSERLVRGSRAHPGVSRIVTSAVTHAACSPERSRRNRHGQDVQRASGSSEAVATTREGRCSEERGAVRRRIEINVRACHEHIGKRHDISALADVRRNVLIRQHMHRVERRP